MSKYKSYMDKDHDDDTTLDKNYEIWRPLFRQFILSIIRLH